VDLTLDAEQAAFRDEARRWLEANAHHAPTVSFDTAEGFAAHRTWEQRLFEGGWGVVPWPEAYGGRGADLVSWLLFEEEYYRAGCPYRLNQNGLFLLGPTLMEHGTPQQQDRFLRPMAAGEEIWAQGWSEPEAGSDMAAIRARAERDGDDWVISGQKTWSTRAAFADQLFGLFRTEPGSQRHRGLSFVLVPLDAPGVTVRPIHQLNGEPGFAEVFFDEVRVPVDLHTLGPIGEGWRVAMSTAGFERGVSLRSPGRFNASAQRLIDLARARSDLPPTLGREVARSWARTQAYDLMTYRTVAHVLDGGEVGPEASLNKLFWSEMDRELHRTALRLLGTAAPLTADAPDAVDEGRWLDRFLFSLSGPIYAGTNEIQRNIVAERVLGLPRS
jgi:alkylation response protein AidB-like acyl-CoA dehydrogenase